MTHAQVNTLKRSTSKKTGKTKATAKPTASVKSRATSAVKNSDLQIGGLNRELLRTFTEFMREEGLASFTFKSKEFEVDLKFASPSTDSIPNMALPHSQSTQRLAQGAHQNRSIETPDSFGSGQQVVANANTQVIKSPFVGTFYRSPAPGKPSFVEVGAIVKPGDALCVLEAMKLMNEIEAEIKCKIVKVLVDDASPVEYGEALFEVEAL